jgi:hypothetical protein
VRSIRSSSPRSHSLSWVALSTSVLSLALLVPVGVMHASTPEASRQSTLIAATPQTIAAGGSDFMCGIRADLTLSCWGRPELGLTTPPDGRFAVVAAGRRDACALAIDSTMHCWGRWSAGSVPLEQPVVAPSGRFLALDVADTHACAIHADQSLVCWGAWQASDDPNVDEPPAGRFTAVAAVHDDSQGGCAIRLEGTIACWGPDTWGEATPPPGAFRAIESGRQAYCATRSGGSADGTLVCWGRRLYGIGEPPAGHYTALAIGGDTGCAIGEDRAVACWGAPIAGLPSGSTSAASVTVGETIAAAVADQGSIESWGETEYWPLWGFGGPRPTDRFAIHRVLPERPDP